MLNNLILHTEYDPAFGRDKLSMTTGFAQMLVTKFSLLFPSITFQERRGNKKAHPKNQMGFEYH